MPTNSKDGNLRAVRTRFSVRAFTLVTIAILLCVGIGGCTDPSTPPGAFTLSSPANNATDVPLTPTFTWTDADGETSYTVEIDNENIFSPPLVHQDTGIAAGTTSFIVPSGVLVGGTTYYWRITAANSAGPTMASNTPFSFTTLNSGALIAGFGSGGVVTSNQSAGLEWPWDIAIDSTSMYVVGVDENPGSFQWRIEKRSLADGSLSAGFGTDGVIASDPSTGDEYAMGVAIDSTAMYVVGFDRSPENDQWRIEKRSLTDGSLDAGFGAGGVVTSNPSTYSDCAVGIALGSTAMYVVGTDASPGPGNSQWRIEKRSLTDGSLDAGFGAGGVVTSNPSTHGDYAMRMAIDSTAIYVAGLDQSLGDLNCQWRIEKRSLTDGNLVAEFGTGGVVTSNPGVDCESQLSIAIDSTAVYIVGHDFDSGNAQWRMEKRSLVDGNLAAGFGVGGVVTSNASPHGDAALGITVDSTAVYVTGYDQSPGYGNSQWRIEKRSLTDGNLVAEFGTGGVVTSNPSAGGDVAVSIAMDSTAIHVVGIDYSPGPGNAQWRIEKRAK